MPPVRLLFNKLFAARSYGTQLIAAAFEDDDIKLQIVFLFLVLSKKPLHDVLGRSKNFGRVGEKRKKEASNRFAKGLIFGVKI